MTTQQQIVCTYECVGCKSKFAYGFKDGDAASRLIFCNACNAPQVISLTIQRSFILDIRVEKDPEKEPE